MAASRRTSPAPRRIVALKRADGEPLTRVDIQYDVLSGIFSDNHEVFSDPYSATEEGNKLCFRDLYIKSILHSPKATKALKDKMIESSVFALDFAMLSLLVNVGRVNTTMSFFPEMKTAIRTYHPVPSLQRTNGNMQDAPRIKHILKTSLLEDEAKAPPSTPSDILARCKVGQPPSTSVTNLIFVLAHHTGPVGQMHFQGRLDFIDLFMRTEVSSASRVQCFLWLCFNYLEAPSSEDDYDEEPVPNPFADKAKPTSPPPFTLLTSDEVLLENQESPEDIAMSEKLVSHRNRIVQNQGTKESGKASAKASVNGSVVGDDDELPVLPTEETKYKAKRAAPVAASAKRKGKRAVITKEKKTVVIKEKQKEKDPISAHLPDLDDEDDDLLDAFIKQPYSPRQRRVREQYEHSLSLLSSLGASSSLNGPTLGNGYASSHRHRYSPYPQNHYTSPSKDGHRSRLRSHSQHVSHPRSMLQQAWQAVQSTDPLVDSDEEEGGDEYTREDYVQRLTVINRLSQQHWPPYSPDMNIDPI
ncbi:hypothetical protein BDN70DRAFT_878070 [Pholiota conissans]|uniref:Ino eighty subunit 1 n=1 Tax=Pholiota conissans TaxID=109636 RepID=A0A9P5Z3A9_9AGAR|nr:hypothetical protein BDN70DRAFT_878070 [Pholiota conissans]